MSTRINLRIENRAETAIRCVVIGCEPVNGLNTGDELGVGEAGNYTIDSSNRVFLAWEEVRGPNWTLVHEMAMTCPIMSRNNACGITEYAGCQPYDPDAKAPVSFTFCVGTPNLADWNSGNSVGDPSGLSLIHI